MRCLRHAQPPFHSWQPKSKLTQLLWLQQGADGSTRAFNSFALRTRDLEPGTCSLEVLDYFDMRGWFPV